MTDQMAEDVRRMVAAIIRDGLRRQGDDASIERLREPGAWTLVLDGETYIARWAADHSLLATVPLETVKEAVGLLRARRGDPLPPLVN